MHLSIVIPAYNEAQRLPETLRLIREYLAEQDYDAEVLVVDDASADETSAVAQSYDARTVRFEVNRGKGAATRDGMLAASGDYRLFFDADGSTPIEMLDRVWPEFERGADVVIGTRSHAESDIAVKQPWYRQEMGRINNRLLRVLALTRFRDTQCGFKVFTAAATEQVFPKQTIERFSFDSEILYIAERLGLSIAELPVRWVNSPDTRVHPIRDASRMVWDVLRIRWRAWRGKY